MVPIKVCSIEECESTAIARGWCRKHYGRWHRHGDPLWSSVRPECSEPDCDKPTIARGWCSTHYARFFKAPQAKAKRAAAKEGRVCAFCGVDISTSRNLRAVFCSRKCKERSRIADGRAGQAALRSYYRRSYGLEPEDVEAMRGRGCDICGTPNSDGRWGQLHVDHCHDSGVVRGVLCHQCNVGLGHFKDDPVRLAAAIAYLEAPMT